MKPFLGILRILAMALVAGLLLSAGEGDTVASSPDRSSSMATLASSDSTARSTGAALFLGAYGFLIMLRRRSLR